MLNAIDECWEGKVLQGEKEGEGRHMYRLPSSVTVEKMEVIILKTELPEILSEEEEPKRQPLEVKWTGHMEEQSPLIGENAL